MLRRIIALSFLLMALAACGVTTEPALQVTSLTPADGATDVRVDVVLEAVFDQDIDESTLSGSFTLTGPGGDVAGAIAYDAATRTATFTPAADLAFDTTYTATIAGSVATAAGETLEGDASWSFTTEAAAALQVSSVTPADGATGVPVDVVLQAVFDQDIDASTLTGAFTLTGAGGAVAGTVAYDATTQTATFTPDADLAFETTYTATIASTVATSGGESLSADETWSFTTAAAADAIGAIVVTPENPDPIAVDGNATVQLDAQATGVVGSPDTSVAWSSSPAGVVTVDATGLVTAVSAGTATITATSNFDGDLTDSVVVTVAEPLVAGSDYLLNADAEVAMTVLTPADPSPTVGTPPDPLFTGGEGPFTYAISTSPDTALPLQGLPPGVTLDTTTGEISGTPTTAGFYREAIDVTDAAGQTIEVLAEITVLFVFEYAQPTYTYDPATTGEVVPASDVTAAGAVGTLSYSMTLTGSSPDPGAAGTFSIDPATGAITLVSTPTTNTTTWTYDVAVCDAGQDDCAGGATTATYTVTLQEATVP